LKIIIKKKGGNKHTISYIREGYEDCWIEADNFLVIHDLCHYAIESSLQYKNAFWGLVASGINPHIFENKETRDALSLANEAWYAEHLANLLLIEFTQGKFDDINVMLEQSLLQHNPSIPIIHFSNVELEAIRTMLHTLIENWRVVEVGDYLSLDFTISA
jgi:hypothetical protein